MTLFLLVKFFHVLLAIVALGANMTYGVWFARANAHPESAEFALRGIKFIDDRIANPAYVLLLPVGIWLAHLGGYSLGTKWISAAMGLWIIAIVIAYAGYTPTLKKQLDAVIAGGINSSAAKALATRGQILAAILAVLVLLILVLMIFKPT